jgi:aminoglycoside 3-N-acetyltransferase
MPPATVRSITADLRTLGIGPDDVVLMHSSYKSLGSVAGGPQAVVEALLAAAGTLVVPTHTPENTDPAGWQHPPVPRDWWATIRDEAPGFDPARTPASRWMGRLAELVRTWPGAVRSDHPQVSFAAIGRHAAGIVSGHRRDDALGDSSPLGAVYRLDGKVLLLGCGHDSNTSLHLAEWRQPAPARHETGSAIRHPDGGREWVTWVDVAEAEDDFERLGAAYEDTGAVTVGPVAEATARLMRQRPLVDFAVDWIARNR